MDKVGLGFIGLGWWGGVLAEGAAASGLADMVSCFARSPDAREAFAAAHGARAVRDAREMLEDPAVDGVVLATPHSTHVDLVELAAAAGKHVFVEKPLALTAADAERAIAATERAGVALQVGHNRRRQPANRRIKELIDSGELGTVLQLEGTHSVPGGFRPGLPRWRSDPAECPLGGMTGLGVHLVDTFHYFLGRAARVTAFSARLHGFLPLDEATSLVIEYERGQIASIATSYFVPTEIRLAVYGSGANAWNEEDGARLLTQARGEADRTAHALPPLDTVADELAEFARCIRGEARPETGPEEGLEVAAVLEAAVRSVDAGRAVDLADVRR